MRRRQPASRRVCCPVCDAQRGRACDGPHTTYPSPIVLDVDGQTHLARRLAARSAPA